MKKKINQTNLFVTQGEVIKEQGDILVNWTIPRLNGGDALFFKIHEEGGSTIYRDCQRILANMAEMQAGEIPTEGIVPPGKAVVTTAGILPVKFIIHTVVPDYRVLRSPETHKTLLVAALQSTYTLITQYNASKETIRKVIFTPVPPFLYGSEQNREAITLTIQSLLNYLESSKLRTVRIVCETPEDYKLYSQELYSQTTSKLERFINRLFNISI